MDRGTRLPIRQPPLAATYDLALVVALLFLLGRGLYRALTRLLRKGAQHA